MHGIVVLLALLAAFCVAVGMVTQHRAATAVPTEEGMSLALMKTLIRSPLWWAGTVSTTAGYGFQALALSYGSLLIVQPLLVSCLLFALPMSARWTNRRVTATEWAWALLLTGALAVFVLLARPRAELGPPLLTWYHVTAVGVPLLVVLFFVANRSAGRGRAIPLSVAVAMCFGTIAVLTKVTLQEVKEGGLSAMLTIPAPYALIALTVVGTIFKQSAFNAGRLQISVPTMQVLDPLVGVVLGVVVLGEQLSVTTTTAVVLGIAVVAMISATIALARREGAVGEELEAVSKQPRGDAATPPIADASGAP